MEQLVYNIRIEATPEHVWQTMLEPETYRIWVGGSWPGSFYEGSWEEGHEIRFLSQEGGGTLARIDQCIPFQKISANHIAVIGPDGKAVYDKEATHDWIGTIEEYDFIRDGKNTEVKVTIVTSPRWVEMFNEGWPKSLEDLKSLCESTKQS